LNYFVTPFLNRASDGRRDDEWLAAQLKDGETRFIPVWESRNLFAKDRALRPVWLTPSDAQGFIDGAESMTLLGMWEGRTYFAIGLSSRDGSPPDGVTERGQFRDLRLSAPLLDDRDSALLAYARAMSHWHHRHLFCGDCGSPTESAEGGHVRVCTNERCAQQHFPRTDPAIIVLVARGHRCLLARKPTWPKGRYSIIAGFVEPGESLEDAVAREVREETGVEIASMRYHSSQPWPFPRSLMLGFMAKAASEVIRVDRDELEHADWFSRQEMQDKLERGTLKLPPRVSVSYRLISEWFDAGSHSPLKDIVVHT
jgi:NAD+ diphosphatase